MDASSFLTLALLPLLRNASSDDAERNVVDSAAEIIRTRFRGVTRMAYDRRSFRSSRVVGSVLRDAGSGLFFDYDSCLATAKNYPYRHFDNLVVVSDGVEDFVRILNDTCIRKHSQPDKVLILLLECDRGCVAGVAAEAWRAQLVRVLISSLGTDAFFAYAPFSDPKRCDRPESKPADRSATEEALSRRVANLNTCPLRVGAFLTPPRFRATRLSDAFDGTEANILRGLARVHNFTVEYALNDKKQAGILRELSEGRVSFGLSAMQLSEERYGNFSFAEYFGVGVVCALPPARLMPAWLKLIKPFDVYMWSAVLSSVAALLLMDECAGRLRLKLRSGLDGWRQFGALVGCAVPYAEEGRYPRFVLTLTLFFYFVVRSAFQASLVNYLMGDYRLETFDSVEEVLASGAPVGGVDLYRTVFGDGSRFALVPRESFNERLQDVLNGEMFAMITSNIELYDHLYSRNGTLGDVHLLKERLGTAPRGAFFPKLSAYGEAFGRTVLDMRAAGLVYKWIADDYASLSSQARRLAQDAYVVIDMTHLLSAFFVLQMGVALGAVAFFMELLAKYVRRE